MAEKVIAGNDLAQTAGVNILLPFPDRVFSPNARHDRRSISGKIKAARFGACMALREVVGRDHSWRAVPPRGPIWVLLQFVPPARYRYDRDNLKARMKPYLDGLADGLRVDDRQFRFPPVHILEPEKPGRTMVSLWEVDP